MARAAVVGYAASGWIGYPAAPATLRLSELSHVRRDLPCANSAGGEFRLHVNGANLELYRNNVLVNSRLLASLTSYTINGGDGGETLRIDELIALPGGIFFNAGAPNSPPGDGIVIALGALDGSTVSYTNATDGVITLVSGAAAATYNFTGIDPIDMTGSTVADLVFNLPGSTDTRLEDNGNPVDGNSQLRDADATPGFDTTTFGHPASSLTLHAGAGDSVTVDLLDSLGSADLTIGSLTNAAAPAGQHQCRQRRDIGHRQSGRDRLDRGAWHRWRSRHCGERRRASRGRQYRGLDLQVSTLAAVNTGSGFIDITNAGDLVIGTVSGIAGITAASSVRINVNSANFTIDNDLHSAGFVQLEGTTFTNNAAVSGGGGTRPGIAECRPDGACRRTISAVCRASSRLVQRFGLAIDLGSQTDVAAGTLELSDPSWIRSRLRSGHRRHHDREHHGQQSDHRQRPLHRLALDLRMALSSTAPRPSRPTSPSPISACLPPPASAPPMTSIRPLRAWSSSTRPAP